MYFSFNVIFTLWIVHALSAHSCICINAHTSVTQPLSRYRALLSPIKLRCCLSVNHKFIQADQILMFPTVDQLHLLQDFKKSTGLPWDFFHPMWRCLLPIMLWNPSILVLFYCCIILCECTRICVSLLPLMVTYIILSACQFQIKLLWTSVHVFL